nr:hypothetical protein [Tanacetum cinerariifolium]
MTKKRILKDYWRQELDESQEDMIDIEINPNNKEDCEDLKNFKVEKMELILDIVLDKLDNGESYIKSKILEIEKMPRTSANVAVVRAKLIKEMHMGGSVQKKT